MSARIWTTANDETSCTVSNFHTWFAYGNCYCIFTRLRYNAWNRYDVDIVTMNTVSICIYFLLVFFTPKPKNALMIASSSLLPPIFIFIQKIYFKISKTTKLCEDIDNATSALWNYCSKKRCQNMRIYT